MNMNNKPVVVAREKHLTSIRDILEVARWLGCEIRWLESWQNAPQGSIAVHTKTGRGTWARPARRRFLVRPGFAKCTFPELVEKMRKILFPNREGALERAWTRRGD